MRPGYCLLFPIADLLKRLKGVTLAAANGQKRTVLRAGFFVHQAVDFSPECRRDDFTIVAPVNCGSFRIGEKHPPGIFVGKVLGLIVQTLPKLIMDVFEVAKHSGAPMPILLGFIRSQVFAVVRSTNQICQLRVASYLAKEIGQFA